jgi:hypothetical protein
MTLPLEIHPQSYMQESKSEPEAHCLLARKPGSFTREWEKEVWRRLCSVAVRNDSLESDHTQNIVKETKYSKMEKIQGTDLWKLPFVNNNDPLITDAFNPTTPEAETGGSQSRGQPGYITRNVKKKKIQSHNLAPYVL